MTNTQPQPGSYSKGDKIRVAGSPAEAASLEWHGWARVTEESAEQLDYRVLQEQAKTVGIKANQSKADLASALATPDPS